VRVPNRVHDAAWDVRRGLVLLRELELVLGEVVGGKGVRIHVRVVLGARVVKEKTLLVLLALRVAVRHVLKHIHHQPVLGVRGVRADGINMARCTGVQVGPALAHAEGVLVVAAAVTAAALVVKAGHGG
jgi:hypothetical protein